MYFVFFKLMNRDFEESHDEMVSRSWFIEDISEEEVIGRRRSISSAYSSICEDDSGKRELVSLMVKMKSNGPRIDP